MFLLLSLWHLFGCLHACSQLYMCTCLATMSASTHYMSRWHLFITIHASLHLVSPEWAKYLKSVTDFIFLKTWYRQEECAFGAAGSGSHFPPHPNNITIFCLLSANINGWQDRGDTIFNFQQELFPRRQERKSAKDGEEGEGAQGRSFGSITSKNTNKEEKESSETENIKKRKKRKKQQIFFLPCTRCYFPDLNFVTFSLTSVRPDCVGAVLDS